MPTAALFLWMACGPSAGAADFSKERNVLADVRVEVDELDAIARAFYAKLDEIQAAYQSGESFSRLEMRREELRREMKELYFRIKRVNKRMEAAENALNVRMIAKASGQIQKTDFGASIGEGLDQYMSSGRLHVRMTALRKGIVPRLNEEQEKS